MRNHGKRNGDVRTGGSRMIYPATVSIGNSENIATNNLQIQELNKQRKVDSGSNWEKQIRGQGGKVLAIGNSSFEAHGRVEKGVSNLQSDRLKQIPNFSPINYQIDPYGRSPIEYAGGAAGMYGNHIPVKNLKNNNIDVRNLNFSNAPIPQYNNVLVQNEMDSENLDTSLQALTAAQMIVSLAGLIAGGLTFSLGIFHLLATNPSLKWPSSFLEDVNADTWRNSLFSLAPNAFVDIWAPAGIGLISTVVHLKSTEKSVLRFIVRNYVTFALWNVFQALWGDMGYRGGLGICIAILSLGVAAASFAVAVIGGDTSASLRFDYSMYTRKSREQSNVVTSEIIYTDEYLEKNFGLATPPSNRRQLALANAA